MDASSQVYVTGLTSSSNFPNHARRFLFDLHHPHGLFHPSEPHGTSLLYSTYWVGNDDEDEGVRIGLDSSGAIYLGGSTYSSNFPTTTGAFQTSLSVSTEDLFASKLVMGNTNTPTPTNTPGGPTPTFTPTFTSTSTPTSTPTPTGSDTYTPTLTPTSSFTPTITYTPTDTQTPTVTSTPTPTGSATYTPTPSPTIPATFTPTPGGPCTPHIWPNPYNPRFAFGGWLNFSCLPTGSHVSLYSVSGEEVNQLAESEGMAQWNGRNKESVPASPGIYFYVIQQGQTTLVSGKVLLTR